MNKTDEAAGRPEAGSQTELEPNWRYSASPTESVDSDKRAVRDRRLVSVRWTASEFIAHQKSAGWFASLGAITLVVAALVYLATRDKITTGVIIVAGVIMAIYAVRKPRVIEYEMDETGLRVGSRFYAFEIFKSYAVLKEGAFSSLFLVPHKRFMPGLTVYYDPADETKIMSLLSDRLPMAPYRDPIDSFMKRIRF